MTRRIEKVNRLLQKEISQILSSQVDFEGSLVTITNVHTTGNLLNSEVLITVIPEENEKKVLKILKRNIFNIQKVMNKKLNMRPVPKIHFKIDEGMKNLYRIDKISRNIGPSI